MADKTHAFTLRLDSEMYDWLRNLAQREMRSISDQTRYILNDYRIRQAAPTQNVTRDQITDQ